MRRNSIQALPMLFFFVLGLLPLQAQQKASTATTPVQMTVTVRVLGENKRMPEINREDVIFWESAWSMGIGRDFLRLTLEEFRGHPLAKRPCSDATVPSVMPWRQSCRATGSLQPSTTQH